MPRRNQRQHLQNLQCLQWNVNLELLFTTRPGYLGVSLWAGAVSIHAWLETLCAARRPDLFLLPLLLTQALTANISTNTTKIQIPTSTNTAKRPDLFLLLPLSSQDVQCKMTNWGIFLSINKFKNIYIDKMANAFIHNLGSPAGKGCDIDNVWMFDFSREDLFSEWGIILAFIMAETFKVRIRNGSETESRINCAHWFGFSTIISDWAQISMLGRTLSYLTEYVYQECLDRQKLVSLKISEFCLSEIWPPISSDGRHTEIPMFSHFRHVSTLFQHWGTHLLMIQWVNQKQVLFYATFSRALCHWHQFNFFSYNF